MRFQALMERRIERQVCAKMSVEIALEFIGRGLSLVRPGLRVRRGLVARRWLEAVLPRCFDRRGCTMSCIELQQGGYRRGAADGEVATMS